MTFEPALKLLVFATTAVKDANIEGYIRKKDLENRNNGLFKIDIASWEDIVDHLERYRTTYNWYVNNCQFKDATDVHVSFEGKDEITIHPEYVKTTTHYVLRQLSDIELAFKTQWDSITISPITAPLLPWNQPRSIDNRWCDLNIRIDNTGSTVIKTPKLIVLFRSEDIVRIDDNFSYCNAFGINEAAKAQINANRDAKREVFQTHSNALEYRPKNNVLVQKDARSFSMSIIPKEGVTKLPLIWQFLCEDYQKQGVLTIKVEPKIEERVKTIEVHKESELKPDEVVIEPKITDD